MSQKSIDVAIVGGGLLGWSAAYRLAKAGQRVLVADALEEGTATNAGAGIIAPGTSVKIKPAGLLIGASAVEYYPRLLAELASDGETNTGYATVGSLFVARDEEEAARLPDIQALMIERRDGGMGNIGEVSLLSGAEAKALFPALSDLPGAIHATGAARVNGRLMRDSLRAGAERHGATIAIGRASILTEGAKATGIEVAGERIAAGQVLISGGAWSAKLGEQLGVMLPVHPQRGQIMHLEMRGQDTSAWPIITGFHSHYILTFPTSRVVCGATREHEAGFDPSFTAGGIEEVLAQAFQVASGLRPATLLEFRVGLRPFSKDEQPILGAVPGWENLFVSTGHGPSGLQLGPVSSAAVSDLMLGNTPRFDLTPFSPERFKNG
jgi:D-amino-acid dehydrogenase